MPASGAERITRYADMFAAIGSEHRLRIIQLLLAAHPGGLVAGEIQSKLGVTAPNLSHHLEKLKNERLIDVAREGNFLRYRANTDALQELVAFLLAECYSRNRVIKPAKFIQLCR